MKDNIKRFIIKLFSLTLAIILAVPAQIFAQSTENQKTTTYSSESSVMGINPNPQPPTTATDITTNIPAVLESEKTADQTADYNIEKSAKLDTQTKELTYRIALTPKEIKELDPFANTEYITAVFAQNDNVDHKDLRLDKVTHLDENGTESQIREKTTKPNILNAPKNITTFSTKAAKPQYGMVYYLTAKVDDKVIENLGKGKKAPSFAIDMQIQDHDQNPFYNNRYALTTDANANLVAMDEAKSEHLIGGLYAGEVNAILTTFPASITWTDFIFAPTEKELVYDIKLDENQDTTNTEIKVEYYQARDNGFAINNSFTQRIPYTNSLKIQIPEGQLAKVVLQTTVQTDKTIDTYSFNGKKIANLAKEGASDSQPTEEGEAEDEDPAGEDTSDITFTDQSGIELNSQSLIETYEAAGKNTEENINFIKTTAQALENYNNETTDWDQFIDALSVAIEAYGVDQATTVEVVDGLISSLSQDKYKVANIDPAEASKLAYEKANGQADDLNEANDTKETEEATPEEIKTTVSTDSGIELNKQSLIAKLKEADKADANTLYFVKSASEALSTYNAETIDYNQFLDQLSTAASIYKVEEADVATYIDDLVAGLNEDNYKVVNLDGAEVAKEATALNSTSTALDGEENVEVDGGAEAPSDKTVDELVKEKLLEDGLTLEAFQNFMYDLDEKYGLTDEDVNRIYGDNEKTIATLIDNHNISNTEPHIFMARDYQNKKFRLLTDMNVLAMPNWRIPVGWWFDVEIGPYLKINDTRDLKPLTDTRGNTIATPKYDSGRKTIRYTFTQPVYLNKTLPIDQELDFDWKKIKADYGDNSSYADIDIVVRPKNNQAQKMPTIRVYSNDSNPSSLKPVQKDTTALNQKYPYDLHYFSHQYIGSDGTVNWDIQIHMQEIKNIPNLNYNDLGLSVYTPTNQGLTNYKISVRSNPRDFSKEINSNDPNDPRGKVVYENGTMAPLTSYNYSPDYTFRSLDDNRFKTTSENLFQAQSTPNETQYYSTTIEKDRVPDILFIHVEATPNAPVSENYDLGIRLTPDRNYIYDMLMNFKAEWKRILSQVPFVIPWKSGDEAAMKFAHGFNLVDTRLPSDLQGLYDPTYERVDYADKSRHAYGVFNETNGIDWHISETIRLQDNQSTLANDIYAATFNSNVSKNHTNPDIEVLEPNVDGSYTRIYSSTNPGNPGSAQAFRNELIKLRPNENNTAPALKPGTIINYIYNTTVTDPTVKSEITIPFSQRFDDGVGTYGGTQSANLRKYSQREIDGDKYRIIYMNYEKGKERNDYNRIDGMIVRGTGDIVYCINATKKSPAVKEEAKNVDHNKKLENISGTDLNSLISRKTNESDKLARRLKAIFYTAEYEYKFNQKTITGNMIWGPEKVKYNAVQASIYRAIDEFNNGQGLNTSEEDSYYRGFSSGDGLKVFENAFRDPVVNPFYDKVIEVENRLGSELDDLVRLDGYRTVAKHTNIQNVIGPVFNSPLEFDKVDKNGNKISGIEFNIYDSNNRLVKNWTTSNEVEKIRLKPGSYTLKETPSTKYLPLNDVTFNVEETRSPVKTYITIDYSTDKEGEETNYTYQSKITNLSSNNFDPNRNQLVSLQNNGVKIRATNIEKPEDKPVTGGFYINKQGSDKMDYYLPGAKFKLTGNNFSKEYTSVGNGPITITGLKANNTYTLTEVSAPDGYIKETGTWEVKLDSKGNVTIKDPQGKISNSVTYYNIINEKEKPKTGGFDLVKYNSDTNKELAGAEFTLYNSNKTQVIKRETTPVSGKISFSNLVPGDYILEETKVPDGFKTPTKTTWEVKVEKDGTTKINGELISTITTGSNSYRINNNNVNYYISNDGSASTSITDIGNNRFKIDTTLAGETTSSQSGYTYKDQVIDRPATAHSLDPNWHWLYMDNYGVAKRVNNTNQAEFYVLLNSKPDLGDINQDTYVELNTNNVSITNVEMKGLGNNDSGNGRAHISNFRNGYAESVWSAASGNAFGSHNYQITRPINTQTSQKIAIPKERFGSPGHWLFIIKVTGTINNPDNNAKLDVKWQYDTSVNQNFNVSNSTVNLAPLRTYTYGTTTNSLVGTLYHNIGNGFRAIDSSSFSINQGNGSVTKTTTVEYIGNEAGNVYPLSSVSFNHNDGRKSSNTNLPYITISSSTTASAPNSLVVYNEPYDLVKFRVRKVSSENTTVGLNGATFQIADDYNFTQNVKNVTTSTINNEDGYATFDNLQANKFYYIKETKAPAGYEITNGMFRIYIRPDGSIDRTNSLPVKVQSTLWNTKLYRDDNLKAYKFDNFSLDLINVENEPKKTEFSFEKQSTDGTKLSDAEFKLVNNYNGKSYSPEVNNGKYTFNNIPIGTYTLEETKAPNGHKLAENENDRKWLVELSFDANGIASKKIKKYGENKYSSLSSFRLYIIKNEKIPTGKFKIKKVDDKGKPVSKAGFTLFADDKFTQSIKGESFVGSDGMLYYKNLPAGTYYLKETTIPEGYTSEFDHIVIYVDENGKTTHEIIKGDTNNNSDSTNAGNTRPGPSTDDPIDVITPESNIWKSDKTNYTVHDEWPGYMNTKDYSELNPDTGKMVSYIMLKPDQFIPGDGGTNRKTYLDIQATNATIDNITIYTTGNGDSKASISKAMDNLNVDNYIGSKDYPQSSNANVINENKFIIQNQSQRTAYYATSLDIGNSAAYIILPKARFDNDGSYVIKVTSTMNRPDRDGQLYYRWNSFEQGESWIESSQDIPAINKLISSLNDRAIASNLLDTIVDRLIPTSHAASVINDDYSQVVITENISNVEDPDSFYEIEVENKEKPKGELPITGGPGVWIGFAILGTALMLVAIAYYGIANDRKQRRSN